MLLVAVKPHVRHVPNQCPDVVSLLCRSFTPYVGTCADSPPESALAEWYKEATVPPRDSIEK